MIIKPLLGFSRRVGNQNWGIISRRATLEIPKNLLRNKFKVNFEEGSVDQFEIFKSFRGQKVVKGLACNFQKFLGQKMKKNNLRFLKFWGLNFKGDQFAK